MYLKYKEEHIINADNLTSFYKYDKDKILFDFINIDSTVIWDFNADTKTRDAAFRAIQASLPEMRDIEGIMPMYHLDSFSDLKNEEEPKGSDCEN
jgi:hypothetical protein